MVWGPRTLPLDPRILQLQSTTFGGERLTRRQIADVQEIVSALPLLSRTELGHTVCVHLGWQTPNGHNRIQSATGLLEALEQLGILSLPARKRTLRGRQRPVVPGARSDPQPEIGGPLAECRPLQLEVVRGREAVGEWNEWVQRYHPLGYRQPMGNHVRYLLRERGGRPLGCLLFDFAARRLPCRDRWIGWRPGTYRRQLRLVVRNARFVLFPWVRVKCLASHALGLAARRLPGDWERLHGYRPVLLETYVGPGYAGTCYQAANWQRIGETAGRPAYGREPGKARKQVWVYPLRRDWRRILLEGAERAGGGAGAAGSVRRSGR